MKTCAICGDNIDRGACGEQHAVITTKDDRHNRGKGSGGIKPIKTTRQYICNLCVHTMNSWLRGAKAEYTEEHNDE